MLDRRTLFGTVAAIGSAAASFVTGRKATAATPLDIDQEPRGSKGRLERLANLDLESRDNFLTGFRYWGTYQALPAAMKRFDTLMEKAGIDPDAEDTPLEENGIEQCSPTATWNLEEGEGKDDCVEDKEQDDVQAFEKQSKPKVEESEDEDFEKLLAESDGLLSMRSGT